MSNFGAYIHAKPDGTPFYVGKGKRKRMRDFYTARSQWHKNITAKYGRDNIITHFMECSSEDNAFALEVGLIKTMKANGYTLCNLSDGGEGPSGYKHDPETVERVRQQNLGRVQSDEERQLRSEALKGKSKPPRTASHTALIASKIKGRKWYNNGKNVCFVHEGHQPDGYVLGRGDRKMISETQEKKLCQK